jgi:hypothetical protein
MKLRDGLVYLLTHFEMVKRRENGHPTPMPSSILPDVQILYQSGWCNLFQSSMALRTKLKPLTPRFPRAIQSLGVSCWI